MAHDEHTVFGELAVKAVTEKSLLARHQVQAIRHENTTQVLAAIVGRSILRQAGLESLLSIWLLWSWILETSIPRQAGLELLLAMWPF